MQYLEISKNYVRKFYDGNKNAAIKNMDGVLFNDETVKNAFGDGWDGFNRYKKDNSQYCYFIKL